MQQLTITFGDKNQYSLNLSISEHDIPRYALVLLEAGLKLSALCPNNSAAKDAQKVFEWANGAAK
jgi:hypothetical protein